MPTRVISANGVDSEDGEADNGTSPRKHLQDTAHDQEESLVSPEKRFRHMSLERGDNSTVVTYPTEASKHGGDTGADIHHSDMSSPKRARQNEHTGTGQSIDGLKSEPLGSRHGIEVRRTALSNQSTEYATARCLSSLVLGPAAVPSADTDVGAIDTARGDDPVADEVASRCSFSDLEEIARTGIVRTPWPDLRNCLLSAIRAALDNIKYGHLQQPDGNDAEALQEEEAALYESVVRDLQKFTAGPPFTIQRLCELVTEPTRYYRSSVKFLRAVLRCTCVVSYYDG